MPERSPYFEALIGLALAATGAYWFVRLMPLPPLNANIGALDLDYHALAHRPAGGRPAVVVLGNCFVSGSTEMQADADNIPGSLRDHLPDQDVYSLSLGGNITTTLYYFHQALPYRPRLAVVGLAAPDFESWLGQDPRFRHRPEIYRDILPPEAFRRLDGAWTPRMKALYALSQPNKISPSNRLMAAVTGALFRLRRRIYGEIDFIPEDARQRDVFSFLMSSLSFDDLAPQFVASMKRMADEKGVRLAVFLVPQSPVPPKGARVRLSLIAALKSQGVVFFDYSHLFDGREELLDNGEPNAQGAEMLGERLARDLMSDQALLSDQTP